MGLLQDLLKEVPLSSVLRERVALAEEKYERASKEIEDYKQRITVLERENEFLRTQIPSESANAFDEGTIRVIVHLFQAEELEDRDVGAMARNLKMERSVLKYHLDRPEAARLAETLGGNYRHGHIYWGLTSEGRRYVVERKLV